MSMLIYLAPFVWHTYHLAPAKLKLFKPVFGAKFCGATMQMSTSWGCSSIGSKAEHKWKNDLIIIGVLVDPGRVLFPLDPTHAH